jgi:hypothetical protein
MGGGWHGNNDLRNIEPKIDILVRIYAGFYNPGLSPS